MCSVPSCAFTVYSTSVLKCLRYRLIDEERESNVVNETEKGLRGYREHSAYQSRCTNIVDMYPNYDQVRNRNDENSTRFSLILNTVCDYAEFLLIGLKNQLAKYTTLHLTFPTLLKNLGFIFDERTSYLLWPNYIFLQSLLLSHSSTSLYSALPRFVNCLNHCYLCRSIEVKLLSPVISLPSYALSTGSESLNASNISSSHLPTKFSQLYLTFIPLYPQRSASVKYSLFISRYSCSATVIILSKNNWSLLSLCFTISLESTPFISLSSSFWYQFLDFRHTYSFTQSPISSSSFGSPLCSSITPSLFHSRLKTHMFHKS